MEIPPAIGIDLGTTYSCAAVFRHGYVEIIPNEQKSNTTPSCVAFTDKQRLIGEEAKLQAARNARNTVYDVKRLIGRKYDDEPVQKDVKQFPFKVEKRDGKPIISVQYKEETKEHTPEEISSMILIKMKQVAEKYLECEISKAVITIPAYFNDAQRESTKIAGKIAGLDVIRVINEPTAAALAYGLDRISEAEKNILVFDLGGGTFDVSILAIEEGVFEIKATTGDTHLGGEDFNNLLVKHFVREFHKKYSKNLNDDQNGLQYLRDQCEYAKCKLSKEETAQIEIKFENIDYDFFITRDLFEELCGELFMSTLKHVEDALNDAKLKKSDINDIVLVGGSTRIPKIQQLLSEFFHGKKLNNTIDPDEVVANGAAIQAAILTGVDADVLQDILLMDVTPFSLGVKTIDGEMKKVVARNITIPVTKTEMFSTTVDNQTSVLVQVYEGERARVEDNNLLGRFQLTGIEKAPRKYPQIEVTFKIDENGILCVSAEDKRTGSQNKIIIKNNKDLLTKEQIDQMIRVAEQYRKDDELFLETIKKLQSLRDYVYYVKTIANQASFNQEIVAYERQQVENKITETLIWIAKAGEHAQIEDIDQIRKEFELVCNPVLEKYKSNYGNSSSPNDGSSSGSNSQGTFTRKNTLKKSPFIEEIDDDDDDANDDK